MNRLQKLQDRINKLEYFAGDENANSDVIFTIINKLGSVLSQAANSDWSDSNLNEYVLSENDVLDIDGADDICDAMRDDVRDIQRDIVDEFA
ncbi:MAG: hypothetical protein ABL919_16545 [Methylococcales bacterium]